MKKFRTKVLGDTANLSNEEWLKWREHGPKYNDPADPEYIPVTVGSSAVAVVMGDSPFMSRLEFFHEKSGVKKPKYARKMNQEILDAGHQLEDFVAKNFPKFMEENCGIPANNIQVINDTNFYQHPDYPFAVVNPDRGLIVNGHEGIMEIKTTGNLDDIKSCWKMGIPPKKYYWQCQYQMEAMDRDYCYLTCMWGFTRNEMASILIKRDREVAKDMMKAVSEFVECCEMGIEPEEQTGHYVEALSKYYISLYGEIDTKAPAVELPDTDETRELIEDAVELYDRKLKLEEEERKLSELEASVCARAMKYLDGKSCYASLRLNENEVAGIKIDIPMHKATFDESGFKAAYPKEYDEFVTPKFNVTGAKKKYRTETSKFMQPATVNTDKAPSLGKVEIKQIEQKKAIQ